MIYGLKKYSFNRKIKNMIKIVSNFNNKLENKDNDKKTNEIRHFFIKYKNEIYIIDISVKEALHTDEYDFILTE